MGKEPTDLSSNSDSDFTLSDPLAAESRRPSEESTVEGMSTLVNERVGNFELREELGRGAFGAVYKARDTNLDRDVAIKFLHNPLDSKRQRLFEREARALAALSKAAAIVEVYQWGEHNGQNYIVLEYVEGSTEKLLKQHPGGLPVAQALSIAADCAEALQAAQERNILHRDIKPANILLEPATGKAKVADFGLARLDDDSGFTLAGGVSGSPPYMSPEQAEGADLDGRSDIFSLGVTLYELLCGERPFGGKSASQIMESIRQNRRTPLQQRRPDLPDSICAIVEKATAHSRDNRYQAAGDLAVALRETLASLERSGQADTRSVHQAKPTTFRRRLNNALAAVVIAVLCLLLIRFAMDGNPTIGNPEEALAKVKEDVTAQNYDEAMTLLNAIKEQGGLGQDFMVNAYIRHIEEETDKPPTEAIIKQAERLGEKIREVNESGPSFDGWTSRPLSFFLADTAFNTSTVVDEYELRPVFDLALEEAFELNTDIDFVNRDNLEEILLQQGISADLSTSDRALQLGQLIGARLLVSGSFLKLLPNSPERFTLKITDIETSKRLPTPRVDVPDSFSSVEHIEGFLADITQSFQSALAEGYPLQGRLYTMDNQPTINIGANVGLTPGTRFDVRPGKDNPPLDGVSVVATQSPAPDMAPVELRGIEADALPTSLDDAWFVRALPEGSVE